MTRVWERRAGFEHQKPSFCRVKKKRRVECLVETAVFHPVDRCSLQGEEGGGKEGKAGLGQWKPCKEHN